jgi:hypothetical protein
MTPLDDLLDAEVAPADNGLALMTELVAAVSWLRRGAMPGLTVWDAIEQALRWRSGTEQRWGERDPLRTALEAAAAEPHASLTHVLDDALRLWLAASSEFFNEDIAW